MNEYEIGRDFQVLRSRIERLESVFGEHSLDARIQHSGISAKCDVSAGVVRDREPLLWKPKKEMQLPPFLHGLLGVPEGLTKFDLIPESKTWTSCQPEPNILYVNWNGGGRDEFYRLQNQVFSIVRVTEPNSGHISCTATYSARLVASGRAKSNLFPSFSSSQFEITLRNAQGAPLAQFATSNYTISCQDNYAFVYYWDFNAGFYDLVAGATWEVTGAQTVDRC
jgi:hypothetical protein